MKKSKFPKLYNPEKALMDETEKNERESEAMGQVIEELEQKIEEYKREYADLIAQVYYYLLIKMSSLIFLYKLKISD